MYTLQPLLNIRLMREDRASGELTAARQAREAAETALTERQKDLDAYNETREERRDRIYDAIIGQTVTMERLDMATEGVARIDEEGVLKTDNVKRAESDLSKRVSQEEESRLKYQFAMKERMKIDEHRSIWLKDCAAEQEHREEGELEDFVGRKQEI